MSRRSADLAVAGLRWGGKGASKLSPRPPDYFDTETPLMVASIAASVGVA